jgi:hypothetical protein
MKKLFKCTLFCSEWMAAIVVIVRGRRGRDSRFKVDQYVKY